MSIFKKVLILFSFSFLLMSVIGFWMDSINSKRIENLIKEKYAKISYEILDNINDIDKIQELEIKYGLKRADNIDSLKNEILYLENLTFGFVKIYQKSFEDEFILQIKYLDDEYIFKTKDEGSINDKLILNILIVIDIIALIIIFLFVLKILSPLKKISLQISKFASGDFSTRIDVKSNDEIGKLSHTFNDMASKLENLITTREELLRDIGHELRTPIAKGKFAIEKIDDFSQKKLMKDIFRDLEILTNKLIELERLNSSELSIEKFTSKKLIIESLQKIHIDNEEKIILEIDENFEIQGDFYYLCIALKNLIDNALKYSTKFPIKISTSGNDISVQSFGDELSRDIEYYLQAFTQESTQRNGFGLGLSIVKKIIDKHNFKISYKHKNNCNIFTLHINSL